MNNQNRLNNQAMEKTYKILKMVLLVLCFVALLVVALTFRVMRTLFSRGDAGGVV